MKNVRKSLYLGIICLLLFACAGNMKQADVEMDMKEIFSEKYNMHADTCIRLDDNRFLFVKESEEEFPRKKDLYILQQKDKEWTEIFYADLVYMRLGDPVHDASIENIEGKEYFYIEFNTGGGKRGENVDFALFELGITPVTADYLSYCYYPDTEEYISEILDNTGDKVLKEFLYKKIQETELYKQDDFLVFVDKFFEDKDFQMSRVKFPLGEIMIEPKDDSEIDDSWTYDEGYSMYYKNVPYDKSYFKILDRSVVNPKHRNGVEAGWKRKSKNEIMYSYVVIGSSEFYSLTFKKIKGEWFLTKLT